MSVVFDDATFTYQGGKYPTLKNIDLQIEEGETVLVAGHASAGKTTLCRCMNGLVPHFFEGTLLGKVIVEGVDTQTSGVGELSRIVGCIAQDALRQFITSTVEDEIAFGLKYRGRSWDEISKTVDETLNAFSFNQYRKKNPRFLSGGEQQICLISSFLAMAPPILVLDEVTSNVDPLGNIKILNVVKRLIEAKDKGSRTMIIVGHNLDDLILLSDKVVLLNDGRIIHQGKTRDFFQKIEDIKKTGIKIPDIIQVAKNLELYGIKYKELPLTVDELVPYISELFEKRKMGKRFPPRAFPQITNTKNHVALESENLWYVYPDGTEALRGINVKIYEGEFVALIGQNGSGKTTLAKQFIGLYKATKGRALVFGNDTRNFTPDQIARTVGYCFQDPDNQIFNNSVRKELSFGPHNLGLSDKEVEKQVLDAAKILQLEDYLNEDPFSLSLSLRLRVAVGSILAMSPKILILDEPTTGQDFEMQVEIMDLLKMLNDKGTTLVIITHNMELVARYSKRCIILKDGEVLLDGNQFEIFKQREILSQSSLVPTPATLLAQRLHLPEYCLTSDEVSDYIVRILEV